MSIYENVAKHKEQKPGDELLLNAASMASWREGGEAAALEMIKLVFGYDQAQATELLETSRRRECNLLWAYYWLQKQQEGEC